MYAEWIRELKKLIGLVGQDDITKQIVKSSEQITEKQANIQYICCRKLPFFQQKTKNQSLPTHRSTTEQASAGKILKSDWLAKTCKKSPKLIVLVCNMSKPLEPIEKLQDRFATANAQIASTKEYLRSQGHTNILLNYLIIAGQQGAQYMNERAKEFLKINDRSLQVTTLDGIKSPGQVKRLRGHWLFYFEKTVEENKQKLKKKLDETQKEELKVNYLVKLAVLSDIMQEENALSAYENAHFMAKKLYMNGEKNRAGSEDPQVLISQLEIRTICDVLIFRLVYWLQKTKPSESVIRAMVHFSDMSFKPCIDKLSEYLYHEQLYWRVQFLQSLLRQFVALNCITNSEKDRQKFTELLNGLISYRVGLTVKPRNFQKSQILQKEEQEYLGRLSYKILPSQNISMLKSTRLQQFSQMKKVLSLDSIDFITCLKERNLFRPHQQQSIKLILLRLKLSCGMIDDALTLYNEIVEYYVNIKDFYILNHLLKEIQEALKDDQERNNLVMFHLISLKIADHFQSRQHLSQFTKHLKETLKLINDPQKEKISHPIRRNSLICRIKVDMGPKVLSLAEKRPVHVQLNIDQCIENFFETFDVQFSLNKKEFQMKDIKVEKNVTLEVQPSDIIQQEEILEIKSIRLKSSKHHVEGILKNNDLEYKKQSRLYLTMPICKPILDIKAQYGSKWFTGEVAPVEVLISNSDTSDTKFDIKMQINEEGSNKEPNNECFLNLEERVNILNTKTSIRLTQNQSTTLFCRFSTVGQKLLKLSFVVDCEKQFKNSRGDPCTYKRQRTYCHEITLSVENLFKIKKRLTVPNNDILNKKVRLENEVWEAPTQQKLLLQYSIKIHQSVWLNSIAAKEQSSEIITLSRLRFTRAKVEKGNKLKLFSAIKINDQEQKQQTMIGKLIRMPPLQLKWQRPISTIENIFRDHEEKIRPISKTVGIQLKQIEPLRKGAISQVHYRVMNYEQNRIILRIEAAQSDSLLVIGKARQLIPLGQNASIIVSFKIMPLIFGQVTMPELVVQHLLQKNQYSQYKLTKRHMAAVIV